VIEVSYSSLAFDQREKLALYARAGIPEDEVLDVANRRAEVYCDPGPLPEQPEVFGYASHQLFLPHQAISPSGLRDLRAR
jgi:hypothetical protein